MTEDYYSKKSFDTLKNILNKVSVNIGMDRGLREITLVNLWPEIIGAKFKDNTRLISVINKSYYYDVILVAVSSSAVSQELLFFKSDILRKLSGISMNLKFNIKDIVFTTKLWDKEQVFIPEKNENTTHFFKKNPSQKELDEIILPEAIINKVIESTNKHEFTSNELKDRIFKMIEKDLKTQIWCKNKGFPICKNCEVPLNNWNSEKDSLCPACKYSGMPLDKI